MDNRERQQQDSMKVIAWTIIFAVSFILVMLVIQACYDVINHYFPPHKIK
jgi:hypothetical protein